jgi:quinoprotein glucose dehydrogenase
VVRAFDAVTGAFAWAWDMGRPGDHGPLGPGEQFTRGTPNVWAPTTADEDLGLVFLPTGNATPDYWGAHRSAESEKYASSVVAVDAETGEPRWSFQTVHHDVWDYDVNSQPTLAEVEIADVMTPVVIQATKRGEVFVLDRRTGRPVTRVDERPAPQGAAAGDWLAPTQPYSTGMPSFGGPPLSERDMWGLTPLDQLWCRISYASARDDGPMTPPGVRPSVKSPGYKGGVGWGGVAVDLDRQIMVVNSSRLANYVTLVPRADADALGVRPRGLGPPSRARLQAQAGTPFAVSPKPFLSPLGVPCQEPPYGLLSAVDLRTQKLLWSQPLGTARDSGPMGLESRLPIRMGVPNDGGAVVTRGGLTFIGATQERALRAFETATGRLLWQARVPAGPQATPMTYFSDDSGRQFVVIAAGGHPSMRTKLGDYILAYALPQTQTQTHKASTP